MSSPIPPLVLLIVLCGVHVLQPIYSSPLFSVLSGYSDENGISSGVGGSLAWGINMVQTRRNDLFSRGVKCLFVFIRLFEFHCIHIVDLVFILLSTLMMQAILGGSVQVPTLTGDVLLKVCLFLMS